MKEWFQEKLTISKILDISIEVYRKKFKSLIGYQILFAILMFILVLFGSLILFRLLFFMPLENMFGLITVMFIFILLFGTVTYLSEAGIFHITYGFIRGEEITASDALKKTFSSFTYIFSVVFIVALCLVPLLIALGMGGVSITAIATLQQNLDSASPYYNLGYILLISIISAMAGSYLFYSLHIAIFENEKGWSSIKKSIKYAKGEVIKNALRVLSLSIVQWGVNISLYAFVGAGVSLFYFFMGRVQGGEAMISEVLLQGPLTHPIASFILGVLLNPISSIIWTMYYINMKYSKEGLKIYNKLDHLEKREVEVEGKIGLEGE